MRSLILIGFLVIVSPLSAQQPASECKASITYENRNQVDSRPLSIGAVSGMVQDQQQVPIPSACLGLFTEREHKLVETAVTDNEGRFDFGRVDPGRYRLVVKYEGFCTANLRVQVVKLKQGRKRLVVFMQSTGIDTCSYGDYK